MAWDHLSITKAHLVYIILGGFTSLFMLCSSIIKERLYIGEATVATICGIIFGPHVADLINPLTWGNVDLITLEFSRIVLVVQCFAVGVELPRSYMERHWKSVTLLLIPVMTWGWLITSLFIWGLFSNRLNWLDSLTIAACVTATDPVLASSVVGKGKFAKRVPKHLRDLLSAESGCNDGMAFPFVYLAVYAIRYRPDAGQVTFHWFCYTVLYECLFGAVFGVLVGYAARHAIRYAHEHDLIDRESFLVFYFVLALFCAGAGSILGLDDLLVGFAAGVGFSNDGWFLEKTEESHVSNVIDLLLNLSFFVYFGTIIPWEQFNSPDIIGITPWRLVVLGVLVLLFRRIPVMLLLKPILPDVKTWREALFAGHFGPIGVGGLFVAILARAELETASTTPLAKLPEPGFEYLDIIEMIWPITCFLVITSIIVHGSSIAVFTLGKRINTLSVSLTYTQANEDGPSWMDRLPRIQSRSKSSMSLGRRPSASDISEKGDTAGSGLLPAIGIPGQFLRRQKEEDVSSRTALRRRWDGPRGAGGPISESAIRPDRSPGEKTETTSPLRDSDTLAVPGDESPESSLTREKPGDWEEEEELYQEGRDTVIEDEEGNVLGTRHSRRGEGKKEREEADAAEAARLFSEKHVQHGVALTEHGGKAEETPGKVAEAVKEGIEHPGRWKLLKRMQTSSGARPDGDGQPSAPSRTYKPPQKRGPALAYQFGNTIIVEDEDGEVIKKYDIPAGPKDRPGTDRKTTIGETGGRAMHSLRNMGKYVRMPTHHQEAGSSGTQPAAADAKKKTSKSDEDDERIRFTVTAGGRRMSKAEFIEQMSKLDPKARAKFIEDSDVPDKVKQDAKEDAKDAARRQSAAQHARVAPVVREEGDAQIQRLDSSTAVQEPRNAGPEALTMVGSSAEDVPFHSVRQDLARYKLEHSQEGETAAQRRRRLADESAGPTPSLSSSVPDGEEEESAVERRRRLAALRGSSSPDREPEASSGSSRQGPKSRMDEGETAAERKRRLGALGMGDGNTPDSESDDEEEGGPLATRRGLRPASPNGEQQQAARRTTAAQAEPARPPGIRFAEQPRIPTKDERAAAAAEQAAEDAREAAGGSKGGGELRLGNLRLQWNTKKKS
ncbi:uncharacterized protein EI97DRAFT_428761 [Westerdykella ornata]|uniref:Na+/H+ antiporter-like protein Nha1 n=1 Tax=Westerdykella ornata TaxID=318751 RepID=A0A6A6JWT8_WESOR|nr:uncharacterized protein EI97DRAFT_428761 [Westerdykella ornata]KAF2280664.1 hypothetical protein EI97DRAFT_428761 [Westerdykella ornata]